MTDGGDPSGPRRPPGDRWVISREPPFWVSTFLCSRPAGRGCQLPLPQLQGCGEGRVEHFPAEFYADPAPEHDFGADTDAKTGAYLKAWLRKLSAARKYTEAGAEVTSALASEQQASLRDMAAILHHSYWRVSRLQADLPFSPSRFPAYLGWTVNRIRPLRVAVLCWRSIHSGWILGRQARIIAADSVREARRAVAVRSGR